MDARIQQHEVAARRSCSCNEKDIVVGKASLPVLEVAQSRLCDLEKGIHPCSLGCSVGLLECLGVLRGALRIEPVVCTEGIESRVDLRASVLTKDGDIVCD